MGDMADYYLEHSGWNEWKAFQKPIRKTYACKYCGAKGLVWAEAECGRFRLYKKGTIHVCDKYENTNDKQQPPW
jgi:hypothetical protein